MKGEPKAQQEYVASLTDEDRLRMKEPAREDVMTKLRDKAGRMKWSKWAKLDRLSASGGRYRVKTKHDGAFAGYALRFKDHWIAQTAWPIPVGGKTILGGARIVVCDSMIQAVRACLMAHPGAFLLFKDLKL